MSGIRDLKLMVVLMPVAAIAMVAGAAYLAVRSGLVQFGTQPHAEAARFTERQATGEPMVDRFVSHQSVSEVQAALEAAGIYQWQRDKRYLEPDERYPPRNTDTLMIAEYAWCGTTGELMLQFLNDRLYQASFDPKDLDACGQQLHRLLPNLRPVENNRAEARSQHRRVVTNLEFARTPVGRSLGTQAYVIWQDLRLTRQLQEWDDRFGALPQRLAKD